MANTDTPIKHLGFIVDGNRRWATEQGKKTLAGHRKGAEQLKAVAKHCANLDIPYFSAYVFSTENWKRAEQEVGYLMDLFVEFVERDLDELHQENIKVVHVGSRDNIPEHVLDALDRAVNKTASNTGSVFGFCFNYGGHQELVDAMKAVVESGVSAGEVSEELIAENLYEPELPPLDMVIRTSGEQRLSNFMLWRASYAELYFTDTYWPDFDEAALEEALAWYQQRRRRFGGN